MSAEPPAAAHPAFEIRDGCVDYDGRLVLDHLNLRIAAGQVTALLGENGTGKTTLIRALVGLQPLSAGEVLVHGQPVQKLRDRDGLALVPQRLPAASGVPISVSEFVCLGRVFRASHGLWASRTDRAAAASALAQMGLADRARTRLDHLSGGQQRRAMIARALAGGAGTILLDEPTAGVDAASQRLIATSLARLSAAGRTLVIVAHGLGPLAALVHRTVVLGPGVVLFDGPGVPAAYDHGREHELHHHEVDELQPPPPSSLLEG